MRWEQMSHHELMAALRDAGCTNAAQVHMAILENNGRVTVIPFEHGKTAAETMKHKALDPSGGPGTVK